VEHDELVRALADAETFRGLDSAEAAKTPLTLKRGEQVYLTLAGVGLVDDGRPPKVTDEGVVTVTDRRVVFQGARSREWAFSKLAGYDHLDDTPATLIRVSNRRRSSGVRYDGADAELFRRRLQLAVARAGGTEQALIASLRQLVEQTRPIAVPAVVELPVAAPPVTSPRWRRYGAWPTWARIGSPIVAVLLLIGAFAPESDDAPAEVEVAVQADEDAAPSTTGEVIEPTTTSIATSTTAPPTTTTSAPPTTTTAPPPPPPSPTTTAPPPPPPPPPPTTVAFVAPAPVAPAASGCHPSYDPCVPVASDVDCAGGSGNGPAYASGPIRVTGHDAYDLDRDGDGVACEG